MTDPTNIWAQRELRSFFDRLRSNSEWRLIPRGVTVLRRKARKGELYDRAEFIVKSKGRTGAAVRSALQEYLRKGFDAPLLHKDWPA